VAGACGFLALSQDPFGFVFTLHTLFLGTIVLAASDAPSTLAILPDLAKDARSSAQLVRIFVASVYLWSALAKAQVEWISGDTLRALAEDELLTPLVRALILDHAWARSPLACAILGVEIALPLALLAPNTRRGALACAFAFHAGLEGAAHPDVMTAVMTSLLLVFLA
jgi:hypothetical protein